MAEIFDKIRIWVDDESSSYEDYITFDMGATAHALLGVTHKVKIDRYGFKHTLRQTDADAKLRPVTDLMVVIPTADRDKISDSDSIPFFEFVETWFTLTDRPAYIFVHRKGVDQAGTNYEDKYAYYGQLGEIPLEMVGTFNDVDGQEAKYMEFKFDITRWGTFTDFDDVTTTSFYSLP